MDRIPRIIEISLFLLIVFLLGCIVGWALRKASVKRLGGKSVPPPSPLPSVAKTKSSPKPELPTMELRTTQSAAENEDAKSAESARPASLPAPREGGADDLKKINGVGPKIEKTLNELGIYHFDQIAAWDRSSIDWVDDYLSFRGRIDRDGWVEQAKSFSNS